MKILIIMTSVLIGIAGIAKVIGVNSLADQFKEFGLPLMFMRLVGALEVAAAVGLQVEILRFYASAGLALLLVGAIVNHMKVKHPIGQSFPATLILVLSIIISLESWQSASRLLEVIGLS